MSKIHISALAVISLAATTAMAAEHPGYRHLGTGSLVDAWVTPGIMYPEGDLNPENYPFEVEVFESETTPGVYLVESPWTSDKFQFADRNANTTPCDLIIDATRPDFVIMEAQKSGFVYKGDNHSINYTDPFYIGTQGCAYLAEGNSIDDIIAFDPELASTLSDGVITLSRAVFGRDTGNGFGYVWSSMPKASSVLTLPQAYTERWVPAGELTFTDGFITPGYLGDPFTRSWKVPFEKMEGRDGLYRLTDPYSVAGCPLREANDHKGSAWVVIDATDPDIVLIAPQFAGFTDEIDGETMNFYIGNDAGNLHANELWAIDDIKEYLPNRLDKMRDGIITIVQPLFGKNSSAGFGMQWTGPDDKPLVYPARFVFPWADEEPDEPTKPEEPRDRTFYEGFEGYRESYGLAWIPEGWTQINTDANRPTDTQLSHNVNNTWFTYVSSDMFQDYTPDGDNEVFIHYAYDGDWCTDEEQDEWLVSPAITLGRDERLSFLLQADFLSVYNWRDHFDFKTMTFAKREIVNTLKVMVTDNGGDTWTEIWDLEKEVTSGMSDIDCWNGSDLTYEEYTADLAAFEGKTVQIAFRYMRRKGNATGNSMILDRVIVDHPAGSSIPTVDAADAAAEAVYFDLSGRRIADIRTAPAGIYIERRGTSTRKITLRR